MKLTRKTISVHPLTRNLALSLGCVLVSAAAQAQNSQHHVYTFRGDAAGDALGQSVGGVLDVNKDGVVDVLVGAHGASHNGVQTGSARVLSGRDGKVLLTVHGDSAGDLFGYCVAGVGDVNRDSYPDFIVGAPFDDNNGTDSGSARVFSGKDGKVLYTFNGDSAGDRFGFSVEGARDVNKDRFADLVVGAWADDNNGADSGSVRVFSGKDGKILYTFNGDAAGDSLGHSVAGVGDVNKDGYPDLFAGALGDDNNGSNTGSARVFSGKDGKILYTFNGDSAVDRLGYAVGAAKDVNGDGYPDLIAGALLDDNNGANSGSARVFSGKDGTILYTFYGDSTGDRFGAFVGGAGDVNGDGFADVVAGAPGDDNNGAESGSARVFSGKDGKILFTFNGDAAGDGLSSIRGIGDLNKDGYADLIVGALGDDGNGANAGSARVYSGRRLALATDTHVFSLAKANTQNLSLDAGVANQGRSYWVFGSATGTSPGVTLGSVTIPLIPDPWTELTIGLANTAPFVKTRGVLNANGRATARIQAGPVNIPTAVGIVLYHAYLVYDAQGSYYMASNAEPLTLEK